MILSVVVSRLQKAQWERIEDEFKGIDYELIVQPDTQQALQVAKGRYIVFLEEDSAFEPTTLRESLNCFLMNPSYRKLAMVAPVVDFDNFESPIHFGYQGTLTGNLPSGEDPYPTSIGYVYGAVMRTSALKKLSVSWKKNLLYISTQISEQFWSNGLRIETNPNYIYYSPTSSPLSFPNDDLLKIKSNSEALKVWKKEFIL